MNINELVVESYGGSADNGFWDLDSRLIGAARTLGASELGRHAINSIIGNKLTLITSELSEAQDHLRDGREPDDVFYDEKGKPDGFGVELADAVIRIADLCGALDIPLDSLIEEKLAYNKTRGHKHGREF